MAIETKETNLTEQKQAHKPLFTDEQNEAWAKAKLLLKEFKGKDSFRYRVLHIAMSELRGRYRKHKGPIETAPKDPERAKQKETADLWRKLRMRVDAWKNYFEDPSKKKLYIITDPNLSPSQRAVQSAHAVAQFQIEHPLAPWCNGILVLLTPDIDRSFYSRNKDQAIMDCFTRWYVGGFDFQTIWKEEDLDNAITSIAILDMFNEIGAPQGLILL